MVQTDSIHRFWYSRELAALHEPRLADAVGSDGEGYRFLWLRSFDSPIAVRVQRSGTDLVVTTSQTSGSAFFKAPALVRRDSVQLPRAAWEELQHELDTEEFWNLPRTSSRTGLDGDQWILEGIRSGRYHIVDRWTPEAEGEGAAVRRLGLLLLRLGSANVANESAY